MISLVTVNPQCHSYSRHLLAPDQLNSSLEPSPGTLFGTPKMSLIHPAPPAPPASCLSFRSSDPPLSSPSCRPCRLSLSPLSLCLCADVNKTDFNPATRLGDRSSWLWLRQLLAGWLIELVLAAVRCEHVQSERRTCCRTRK